MGIEVLRRVGPPPRRLWPLALAALLLGACNVSSEVRPEASIEALDTRLAGMARRAPARAEVMHALARAHDRRCIRAREVVVGDADLASCRLRDELRASIIADYADYAQLDRVLLEAAHAQAEAGRAAMVGALTAELKSRFPDRGYAAELAAIQADLALARGAYGQARRLYEEALRGDLLAEELTRYRKGRALIGAKAFALARETFVDLLEDTNDPLVRSLVERDLVTHAKRLSSSADDIRDLAETIARDPSDVKGLLLRMGATADGLGLLPEKKEEDEADLIETLMVLGVFGVTGLEFGTDDQPAPEYGFTGGRSVNFNVQAADTVAVGLGLDFAGLDLDPDLLGYAARLAWGPVFLGFERASIAGTVQGRDFTGDYDTYTLVYFGGYRPFIGHGVGVIRYQRPRWARFNEIGADEWGEDVLDLKPTSTAVGYVMKIDSLMRALQDGYITGGLVTTNDSANDTGFSLALDTMILVGLSWLEPSEDFKDTLREQYDKPVTDSVATIALYSQGELFMLYYSGWDLFRFAFGAGLRMRLLTDFGAEVASDVEMGTTPLWVVSPFVRLGALF